MAVNIDFRVKNGLVVTTTATIEGITQSTSTNTGVLQVTGGAGIGKNLYVGGLLNVDNTANSISTTTGALQVSGGVGIAKDLYVGNDIRLDGIFYGTIVGSITTATNLKDGTTGQIPYQSTSNVTSFFGPGVEGQLLVSAGTTSTGPVFTNTGSIYVGYSLYSNSSTNISFGSSGSIPIQSSTGKTAFIPIGSIGNILVAGSNTATWVSTSTFLTAFAITATNILGGTVGQIPFQTATNRTSFVGPGTSGQILVSAGATSTGPVFQNTLTLAGSTQATSVNSGALQVAGGAGIGGNLYVGNTLTVLSTLSSTSSLSQNALYVVGGVGIGSSLYVTGPAVFTNNVVFSGSTTNVLSSNTVYTDNIIELHYPNSPGNVWGVNDGKDIGLRIHYYDTQDRSGFLGRNNSDGVLEWIVNSSNDSISDITGIGGKFKTGSIELTDTIESTNASSGTFVVAGGAGIGGNLYVGGTIYGTVSVSGSITTATNLYQGNPGEIPYQIASGQTSFISTATPGFILISSGTDAPLYVSTSSIFAGRSAIANNITNGNVGQLLFQSTSNVTSFVGTGTAGQILVSAGTTSTGPVFTNTGTLLVGYATSATFINVSTDNSSSTTQYITFVGTNSSYTSIKTYSTGINFVPSTGYVGIGITTATTKLDIGGGVKITGITTITNTTNASSTITGALQVVGGAGIGKNLKVQNDITALYGDIGLGNIKISGSATGSIVLNGSTQYLTVADDVALQMGSSIFTIETWFYRSASTTPGYLASKNTYISNNTGWHIIMYANGSGNLTQIIFTGGNAALSATTSITANTWAHVAVVREGTGLAQTKMYINGVLGGTATVSGNLNITNELRIGAGPSDYSGGFFTTHPGRISNFRIVKGTAVYTANFTSSFPLSAISGTVLLLSVVSSSAYLDDSSGNNFTVTPVDSPTYIASAPTGTGVGTTSSFALHISSSTGYLEFLPNVYSSTNNITSSIFTLSNDGSATTTTNALSITNATSATSSATGALTVTGGVGIKNDLYVGGIIYGTLIGSIVGGSTTATNIANGIKGQIPIQSSTGTTAFIGRGNTNNLLQYNSSTNTATWVSTSTIFVGLAASAILATNVASGTTGQIHFQSAASKTAFSGPGTAGTVLVSAGTTSTGPVFQNTLTLAGTTQASSTITGALQVRGGVGIGGDLYVGGTVYASTFDGLITNATTATNLKDGTQGQVPYQSAPGITSFSGPGSYGQLLMSTGASIIGPIFTSTNRLAVGTAVTSTNIAGGTLGSIPYQTSAGKTSFIGIGTNGFVLTSNGTTATWQSASSVVVNYANTATNIKDGTAGQLVYQTGPGASGFAGPGTLGQLLMSSGTSAPLYVGTSSVYVGYAVTANNIAAGTAGQLHYQSAAGTTAFVNTGAIGTVLVSNGTDAPAYQNTLTLAGSTQATTTNSGALQVVGGVGIGGNLVVGGTISGIINGTINGTATTATNIEKGLQGQIPIQSNTGTTSFISTGSNGNLLQYNVNTATWVSTSSIVVGNSINSLNSNNLTGGDAGSIPIQSENGVTSYIPIGTSGFILTANGTTATWENASNSSAGTAVTATNLALGTVGQVPYQVGPGSTGFVGPGTTGTILVSAGDSLTGPVFTSTSSIYVGYSTFAVTATHITAGTQGQMHYQSNPGQTAFTGPGTAGTILVSAGTTSTGPVFQNTLTLAGTTAASSTSTGALQVRGGVGIAGDLYVGGAIYGSSSISGSISTATNIANGTAGQLHYQSAPGITGFVNTGTVGNVLVTNGTSAPTFNSSIYLGGNLGVNGGNITTTNTGTFNLVNTTATTVNFAGEATTIAIGKSGGTTTVSGNLTVTGNWTVQGTTTIVDSTVTNISDPILILGGPANNAVISADDNKDKGIAFKWHDGTIPHTGFFGFDDSTGFFTFLSSATITNEITVPAGGTTKGAIDAYLAGGSSYSIHYQSSPNVTAFLAAGTAGQLLQTNGTGAAPIWVSPSGLSAANAANITGGTAGQIVIQSGTGATSFVPTGGTGNLLQYDASNTTATWISTSSLRVGYSNTANTANTATNLVGGSTGSVVYQSSTGTTAFLAATTSGYILSTQGTGNVPAWINPSASLAPSKLTVQSNITAFEYIVGVAGSGAAQDAYIANGTIAQVGFNAQTGNVALGTTTPLNKLHIVTSATASAYHIRLEGHNTAGIDIRTPSHTSGVQLAFDGSGGFQIKQSTTGLPIYFNMNGTTKFLVTGTGAVSFNGSNSFGTSGQYLQSQGSAGSPLWVDASAVATQVNTRQESSNATYYPTFVDSNNASATAETVYTTSSFAINPSTGYVGIGTSSPTLSLDVAGRGRFLQNVAATSGAIVLRQSASDTEGAFIQWVNNANTIEKGWLTVDTSSNMKFATVSTERVRILAAGNVGIGYTTTQSGALLAVNGGVFVNGIVTATSFVGAFSGTVTGAATQINTQQANSNATYYPTFVDSNNASATAESLYTTSSFTINPSTGFTGVKLSSNPNTGMSNLFGVGGSIVAGADSSPNGTILLQGRYSAGALTTFGTEYSSGGPVLGCYVYPSTAGTGAFLSSYASAVTKGAYTISGGTHNWYVGSAVAVTIGSAVTMTNPMTLNANGLQAVSLGVGTAPSGTTGEIRASNEITAYYSSDARLKENITPIENPIKMLEQIRGVYFDWTDEHINRRGGEDGYFVRKHDIGVIAQEVEAILPEIVATRDDGFKAVKYEKIVPLLIETIKEQQKQIDQIMATLKNLINK